MAEKCKKLAGGKLLLCSAALLAARGDFIVVQTMRDMDTGKKRERLAIQKGKRCAPLNYCPWCRSSIDTTPAIRAAADFQLSGGEHG